MIYVTSDLHGCSPAVLQQLLDSANFSGDDYLFVLGDVIDRGDHGAELLLWLTEQTNVQLILGNHEALLLSCSFVFEEITENSLQQLTPQRMELVESWLLNGGGPTLTGLQTILKRSPEQFWGILDYLRDAPLYDALQVEDRNYVLVHAGLGNFHPGKALSDYTPGELLFARPTLETRYDSDATVIFGHTPTVFFGEEHRGRAVKTGDWICIDTGAAMGDLPMLLRLDDLKEFYLTA